MSVWTYKSCFLVTKHLLKVGSEVNPTPSYTVLASVSLLWTCSGNTLRTPASRSNAINRFSSIYEKCKWLQRDSNPQPLGCGFESRCGLNRACFVQGVPWHSGNYRVYILSKTRSWHDKNLQNIKKIFLKYICIINWASEYL